MWSTIAHGVHSLGCTTSWGRNLEVAAGCSGLQPAAPSGGFWQRGPQQWAHTTLLLSAWKDVPRELSCSHSYVWAVDSLEQQNPLRAAAEEAAQVNVVLPGDPIRPGAHTDTTLFLVLNRSPRRK